LLERLDLADRRPTTERLEPGTTHVEYPHVTSYEVDVAKLYRGDVAWALGEVNSVDLRSNISFRYYSTGSPFEYENIRFLYVRKRLIEDEGLHTKDPKKGSEIDDPAGERG
jgi:ABC-type transporter lipoprotein component MlaA